MKFRNIYLRCSKRLIVGVIRRAAAVSTSGSGRFAMGALGLMATTLIVGCSPKYYSATSQNVPLIDEKGKTELNMAGNLGQVAFHAAHGLGESIAVKADVAAVFPTETFGDIFEADHISNRYAEVGVGYFKSFENRFVLETYAIAGYGVSRNDYPIPVENEQYGTGRLTAPQWILGLQPNFGYKTKHFELALSARLFHLQFTGIQGALIYNDRNQGDILRNHKSHFIAEPALTCRIGSENAKIQIQWVYIDNSIPDQKINFLGTFGLSLAF